MKTTILVLSVICFTLNLTAQRGYGISSAAYAYHHGGNGRVLSPKYVVEEEILNYHTHKIESASYNDPVKISHQWGNENVNSNTDEMILQLGLSTHRAKTLDHIPPANLSLVVDVSGSMSGSRIEKCKEAMKEFVKQLRPSDLVSLVLFGNQVSIPHKSQKIGDKKQLLQAIDNIQINGSTNVHLGMKEGYKQVASTYLREGNNRVIVFSDAMANTGIIDPDEILNDNKVYIKDIDLTFIGVGMAFNQDFARQIKTRLRGHMHFVQDSREITKIFKEEVEQFLVAPYGKNVKLTIELPQHLALSKFYGYKPSISGNKIELELDDMQGGLTQIFVLKLEKNPKYSGDIDPVKFALSFTNQSNQNELLSEESSTIVIEKNKDAYNKLENPEVKKNYCIAFMASQLKEACISYNKDKDEDNFYYTINEVLATIDSEYKTLDDDLKYVYDLLSNQTDSSKVAKNHVALNDNL